LVESLAFTVGSSASAPLAPAVQAPAPGGDDPDDSGDDDDDDDKEDDEENVNEEANCWGPSSFEGPQKHD
jgi:ribosomal protein L12E/L44/L45/RPP1/RPP2